MFMLLNFVGLFLTSYADFAEYDQRQSGDLNVQVDLKDLQIFAILKGNKEEYVDYDYAYDYSELTIKPQNRTTPRPYNGTQLFGTKDKTTTATSVLQEHTTAPINNDTTSEFIATTSLSDKDFTTIRNDLNSTTEFVPTIKMVSDSPLLTTTRKNCRKGYVLNKKGHCQLKLNTNDNALLRLVKLSQKLKSRRENKNNDQS